MQITATQLSAKLQQGLKSLYTLHGDEPLLVQEAADAIRAVARGQGYTFVSHQQEVGTGYFDKVTTIIQGGASSVTALTGSTEEEQF